MNEDENKIQSPPSRFNSIISFFFSRTSHTTHTWVSSFREAPSSFGAEDDLEAAVSGRTSVSVHVRHTTCEQGFITGTSMSGLDEIKMQATHRT
jgi:hypothetical protein